MALPTNYYEASKGAESRKTYHRLVSCTGSTTTDLVAAADIGTDEQVAPLCFLIMPTVNSTLTIEDTGGTDLIGPLDVLAGEPLEIKLDGKTPVCMGTKNLGLRVAVGTATAVMVFVAFKVIDRSLVPYSE